MGCILQGVEKHYSGAVPEIDAIEDMHVTEPEAVEAAQKLAQLQSSLKEQKDSMEASVSLFLPSLCNLSKHVIHHQHHFR